MSYQAVAQARQLRTAPNGQRIKAGEKLVLMAIADHFNEDTGCAWPGEQAIGDWCGLDARSVRRYRSSLAAKGLAVIAMGDELSAALARLRANRYPWKHTMIYLLPWYGVDRTTSCPVAQISGGGDLSAERTTSCPPGTGQLAVHQGPDNYLSAEREGSNVKLEPEDSSPSETGRALRRCPAASTEYNEGFSEDEDDEPDLFAEYQAELRALFAPFRAAAERAGNRAVLALGHLTRWESALAQLRADGVRPVDLGLWIPEYQRAHDGAAPTPRQYVDWIGELQQGAAIPEAAEMTPPAAQLTPDEPETTPAKVDPVETAPGPLSELRGLLRRTWPPADEPVDVARMMARHGFAVTAETVTTLEAVRSGTLGAAEATAELIDGYGAAAHLLDRELAECHRLLGELDTTAPPVAHNVVLFPQPAAELSIAAFGGGDD